MRLYTKLAWKYMIKYPQRTIAMVLSITLCVFLIVSIGSLSESAKTVNILHIKKEIGVQHVIFREVAIDKLDLIRHRPSVKRMAALAYYDDWVCPNGISVNLLAADTNILYMEDTQMQAGRFPSQSNEIAMEAWVLQRLNIAPELGQELSIALKTENQTREFILTGIIKDRMMEKSTGSMEAFLAYKPENLLDNGAHSNVLLEFDPDVEMKAEIKQLGQELGSNQEEDILPNNTLLWALGQLDAVDEELLLTALLLLLVGGMVIYSVYNISVLKRIHDYGMMRAIGADSKQVAKVVIIEAAIIYLTGTALGIGLGVIFVQQFKGATSSLFSYTNLPLDVIVISSFAVTLAILVALGAIMAGVIRALLMTARVSPITAINRSSQDEKLKIGKKETRLEAWLGITGKIAVKNLKRNKKAVIFTIISMSIGCTLYMVNCFQTEFFARYWDYRNSVYSNRRDEFRLAVSESVPMQIGYSSGQIAKLQEMPQVQRLSGRQVLYTRLKISSSQLNGIYGENYVKYMNEKEPVFDKRVEDIKEEPEDRYEFAFPGDHEGEIVIRNTVVGLEEDELKSLEQILGREDFNSDLIGEKPWTILYIPEVNKKGKTYSNMLADIKEKPEYQAVLNIKVGDTITLTWPGQGYEESLDNAKLIYQYEKYKNRYTDKDFIVAGIIRYRQDMPEEDENHLGSDYNPYLFISKQEFRELSGIDNYRIVSVDMKDDAGPADYQLLLEKLQETADMIPGTFMMDSVQLQQDRKNRAEQNHLFYIAIAAVLIIIGALSMYNNIYYNLISRLREHGIMKAVGLTGRQFRKMIRFEGLLYGAMTAAISCGLALIIELLIYCKYVCFYQHPLLLAKGFFIEWKSFTLVIVINLLIGYAATWGPIHQSEKIEVTEAIHTIE